MRNNKERKKQILASVIALMLVFMMILSMFATVRADVEMNEEVQGLEAVTVTTSEAASAQTTPVSGTPDSSGVERPKKKNGGRIYIDNIDVTDMTEEEASAAVERRMKELSDSIIVFYADEQSYRTTAGKLGLGYSNRDVVKEALSIGRKGNVYKRFLAEQAMKNKEQIILKLFFTVSPEKVREVVEKSAESLNCDAQSNGLKLNEDNSFTITGGRNGVDINVSESVEKVITYMEDEWTGGQGGVELKANVTKYKNGRDQLSLVTDLLGSGRTAYATGNRSHDVNVEIAVRHIDGTVLYPGEEFSAEKVIGPTTAENGFLPGDTYEGTKVVKTYGGGVCQTSTTLYNAVIRAELEVTERHNHSYLVSYVDPGFDAAISEGSLDFRFKNNSDAPIYIQGITKDGYLTFNIYGHETRDPNRTISFESRVDEYKDVEKAYDTDATKPLGSIESSGGIQGCVAELWKLIYVNGEFSEEERVNSSNYQMMPYTFTAGTKDADGATLAAISAACQQQDLGALQVAVSSGSTVQTAEDQNYVQEEYVPSDDGQSYAEGQ
uniref:Putative vancomycin resistance protein n=1 Tax=Eubacterium cellulosolvens (strain ATCC 43171 / JCM 9499 / 6) TaxID=633697 RepID=I5ARI1_EUBC6